MLGVRVPSGVPRRSKVRFAPASFYACGKKDVIRSLPCSPFPTATRCAGLAVGGPPCGRHFSRLRNIDFNRPFPKERHAEKRVFLFGVRRPMARSAPRYFKAQGGLWLIGWPPDIFGASVPAFPGGWEGEDVLQTPDCIAHRKKITTSDDVVISGGEGGIRTLETL